ncbi:hypothetical protein ACMA1D_31515 [Streptomyces sp. 796.1]|uniref:hypothetical protein n=1 Tax=Streptomyces sp. 796.1 TaxID=3163029 RepID=UPI0039C9F1B4
MHMNSAPHLLTEDRPDFEHVLDAALHTAEHRPDDPTGAPQRLSSHQLRTMALGAAASITACAAVEYDRYVQVRAAARPPGDPAGKQGAQGRAAASLGAAMGDVTGRSGAGVVAMLAVLAPALAGSAAVIFLVVGALLRVFAPDAALGAPLVTAGWVFAVCAAVGILIAATALLVTAVRNGGTGRGRRSPASADEVARAREAWHLALLERGVLPFVQQALANADRDTAPEPAPAPAPRAARPGPAGRTPHLGYSRPGFTSPGDGRTDVRPGPRYSSPDFTSPEFGGQDHRAG